MLSSSRCATWIAMGPLSRPLSGRAFEIRGRIVSTPSGVSSTSQQGGGSTPAGHFCSVPITHPRRCKTMKSGELKSLLETMPVRSQNNCGALNVSVGEIKSAASRRVRKSRGEQSRHEHNKAARSSALETAEKVYLRCPAPKGASDFERLTVSLKRYPDTKPDCSSSLFVTRMNVDYRCERILTNCARLRGRKGADATWPSNFFDQRPATGVWQAGQSPSAVNL